MSAVPRLKRTSPPAKPGIVHLGPGAFFKAFNAVYTDDVLQDHGGDWGIIAVSLQSDRARQTLEPQGCVYTSVSLEPDRQDVRIINSVSDVMVASEQLEAVLDAMADPNIAIVSLTITEKGYCHNPSSGGLRLDAPAIIADLERPQRPTTAPGIIVEALARRCAAGRRPFTVLSCDNLPNNGAMARRIVLDFARARDPGLADWIAAEGRFPSTMVDRITPATTQEDVARLADRSGYLDSACVQHEPFRQWVIEDDFVDARRPAWESVGAQFVSSVHAHELMKLRCLNGTHSTLAYLGYLAGYETISDAVADANFSNLCKILWRTEILPTVPPPEEEDLNAYVLALLQRYQNGAIQHRTWQIAMDGSQKLPQRLLGTIQDQLNAGVLPYGLCLAVASWMRYVGGVDESGEPIDVRDPLADALKASSDAATTGALKVSALLDYSEVFDPILAADDRFRSAVTSAYQDLARTGARATVAAFVARNY